MPYSNSWDETQPLGSADSDTIDEIVRQFKVDVRERMNSILDPAHQWDQDPIALPIPGSLPGSGGPREEGFIVGPHNIYTNLIGTVGAVTDAYVSVTGDGIVPIPVPLDGTITAILIVLDSNGNNVNWLFRKILWTDASPFVTINNGTANDSTPTPIVIFSGNELVNAQNRYQLVLDGGGAAWEYYGMKTFITVG